MIYKIDMSANRNTMDSNDIHPKYDISKMKGYVLNLLFGFIILGLSVIFSSPTLLIPQHNAIINQEYWYEVMISASTVNSLGLVINTMFECQIVFKEEKFVSLKYFSIFFIGAALGVIIPFSSCYLIWTVWLGNNNPMPFVGFCYYISYFVHLFQLWMAFPKKDKEDQRKRIGAYFLYRFWFLLVSIQNMGLRMIFSKVPSNLQLTMSLVLPMVREFNHWILTQLLEKTTDSDKIVAKLVTTISINVVHAFFVAIIISSMANKTTSFCILGVDFLLNLYSCYKIFKMKRKIGFVVLMEDNMINSMNCEIHNLFSIEAIEVFIPLILGITVSLAYYGPNGDILGGIRNNYWHYKEIQDIWFVIAELALMFAIDLLSFIFVCFVLYRYSSIDFFYEGYKLMKSYWPLIAVKIAGKMSQVSMKFEI